MGGMTPLMAACSSRRGERVEAVQFILEQNPDIDCQDRDGRSAVYLCAQNEYSKCLKLLIDHGANINLANAKGIMSVVINGWVQLVKHSLP